MKQAFMIIGTLIALILHISLVSVSPILRFGLNLPLLFVVTWSLIDRLSWSVWVAVVVGIALDTASEASFGVMMVSLVIAVIGANLLFQKIITNRTWLGYLFLIESATLIYWTLFWSSTSLLYILNIDNFYWGMLPHPLWQNLLLTIFVHAVVAFFAYQVFSRILKSFRRHFLPLTKA